MSQTKINKLIEKLHKLDINYHIEVYNIISEIYNIKKKKNPKYTLKMLHSEKGISDKLSYPTVVTIMAIEHITEDTFKLIDKGLLTVHEVANLIRRCKKLKNPKSQDKFFKNVAKDLKRGKLSIRNLRVEVVREFGQNSMTPDCTKLLQNVYEIRSVKKNILSNFHSLERKHKESIAKDIEELSEFIKTKRKSKITIISLKQKHMTKLRKFKLKGVYGTDSERIEMIIDKLIKKELIPKN